MLAKSKLFILTLLTLLSTAAFASTVKTEYTASVCGSGKYLFGCEPRTSNGNYDDVIGDSTVTLHLFIGDSMAVKYTAEIEPGQKYLFGCGVLTADGEVANYTLPQAGCGCDSTIQVTIKHKTAPVPDTVKVEYNAKINSGESYLFGCRILKSEGTYSDTLAGAGRDSVVTVHLSFATAPDDTVKVKYDATIQVEENYLFGCHVYKFTESGPQTLYDTLPRLGGGDSVVVVNLTVAGSGGVGDTVKVKYEATIKPGEKYLFGCRVLSEAGLFSDTLAGVGRDSVVTVDLKFATAPDTVKVKYEATIQSGEKYLFGCRVLSEAGLFSDTLAGAGRDSVVTVDLKFATAPDTVKVKYDASINAGQKYLFGCRILDATGVFSDTLAGAGRDSVVSVNLTVVEACTNDTTFMPTPIDTCDVYHWDLEDLDYVVSGKYYHDDGVKTGTTCHHYIELNLIIRKHAEGKDSITGCDSVQFKTEWFYADTLVYDTIAGGAASGCDSIVAMKIKVKKHATGVDQKIGCDSVIFKGVKYVANTLVYDTLTAANGCDSIVAMTITVNHSVTGVDLKEGCDSVIHGGIKFIADTTVYDTLTAANGCDSIVTVTIKVKKHATGVDQKIGCDSVIFKGVKYIADTLVYDTLTAANLCDSIVAVTITVKKHAEGTDEIIGCDSVVFNGVKFIKDTLVYDTLTAANLCDSIVAMTITVNYSDAKTLDVIDTCNLYKWHDSIYTKTGIYYDTLLTSHNCDSICTLDLTIQTPYESKLTLEHYYGDRVLMVNRTEINAIPGWYLDSLDIDHPEYVEWYRIGPAGDTTYVGNGYYLTTPNGDPVEAGIYFAKVTIAPNAGTRCGSMGQTENYAVKAAAPAPALVPSFARPGEEISVINLDPTVETTIRLYTAEGVLQRVLTSTGDTSCTFKAAHGAGFYLVELDNEGMKSTLRYIVK